MAELKLNDLPVMNEVDFTDNDRFVIVDNGKARAMTKLVFQSWLTTNVRGEKGEQGAAGSDGRNGANGKAGLNGEDGLSAYQVAVQNGYVGTQSQWLLSLKGTQGNKGVDGLNGKDGLSAYQIAVQNGYVGTQSQWLLSLKGEKGDSGTVAETVSGFVNLYQASKVSKEPPITSPTPEAPTVGGVNALSEAVFSTAVVGDTGWLILNVKECATPDWAITRNGKVIATWDYSHPDVITKVYNGSAVMSNPQEADFLNMEITIYIGDTTGLVNYKLISNCKFFSYKHGGAFNPFTRVKFSKLPDVKNFRIEAPKSILTVPETLPSTVNSLQKSFEGSDNFNDPNVVGWDVSKVSNFSDTFFGCKKFNQPIGVWDMSNAWTIDTMFFNATNFAQPISDWNTRYVTSMVGLLSGHLDTYKPPSQDLSMWCVPLLANYEYTNVKSGLGLKPEHMPIWGTCPRGEDLI